MTLEQRADVVWGHRVGVTCGESWEPENAVRAFVFLTLDAIDRIIVDGLCPPRTRP